MARELGKSASLIARWSARHDWASRVAAWDAEEDRRKREAHLDQVEQMSRRHAEAVEQQLRVLCLPAAELARRLDATPQLLHELEVKSLLELVQKAARPVTALMEAERQVRGDGSDGEPWCEHDAARREAEQMSREELEAYLLGVAATAGAGQSLH